VFQKRPNSVERDLMSKACDFALAAGLLYDAAQSNLLLARTSVHAAVISNHIMLQLPGQVCRPLYVWGQVSG
jgi:hypothetical protein